MNDLEAKNISLRPMKRRDKDAIFRILSDPAIRLPFGLFNEKHFCKDTVTGWCKVAETVNKNTPGVDKFYTIKKGQCIIGYFGAGPNTDFLERADRWEIGYFLDARYRGQGIVPDILSSFMRAARRDCLVREFYATIKPDNYASQRTVEKLGFTKNGVDKSWAPYIFQKDGSYKKCRPPKIPMNVFELKVML